MKDLSNDNVIHIRKNGLEYLQFRKLLEYQDILKHAICFKPLNFRSNNIKEEEATDKNCELICKELGIDASKRIKKKQTHSDNIEIITNSNRKEFYYDTDGIITNEKEIALPIITADCIACMIFDPVKKVIANVHSGWRGTVQRIIGKAIKMLVEKYNCNPKDIICCIAPSILKCHFEVQEEVKDIFEKEFSSYLGKDIISKNMEKENSYFIDTVLINRLMLKDLGLKEENIIESKICTVCHQEFHSYRREKELSGRNLNIICLK